MTPTTQATAQAAETTTQAAPQSAIPSHLITRLDFGKFWEHFFLQEGSPYGISRDALVKAKDELLNAGVPALTVAAYFMHLYYVVEDDRVIGIVEGITSDLQDLANQEEAAVV